MKYFSTKTIWYGLNLGVEQLTSLSRNLRSKLLVLQIIDLLLGSSGLTGPGERSDRPWGAVSSTMQPFGKWAPNTCVWECLGDVFAPRDIENIDWTRN